MTVFIGLCAALVFAPLAFGAVHFWAYTMLEILLLGCAAVWCLRTLIDAVRSQRQTVRQPIGADGAMVATVVPAAPRRAFCGLAACVLGAWLLFTVVPLPPPVVQALSPATYALLVETLPGWPGSAGYASIVDGTAPGILPATWRPLALSPFLAHAELLRILAYVIAFLIVAYYPWAAGRRTMHALAYLLIIVALVEASYFFLQDAFASPNIYWYRKPPSVWLPSGTYINRNHFAGFLEMITPLAGGLGLGYWARFSSRLQQDRDGLTRAQRQRALSDVVTGRDAFPVALSVCVTAWLVMALYRSLSRGGFLSPLAASCLLAPLLFRQRRSVGRAGSRMATWMSPAMLVLGVALSLVTLSLPELAQRLEAAQVGTGAAERWMPVRGALAMVADFPLAGVGPGNFEFTFPAYRDFGGSRFTHVHNDYLELAVEAGLPALLLVAALIIGLYRRAGAALRNHTEEPYLLWGALVGVTALLLHSWADFNLHIPANALVFAVLLGIVVRLSAPEGWNPLPARPVMRMLASVTAFVLLCVIAAVSHRPARAEAAFRGEYPDSSLHSLLADGARPPAPAERVQWLEPLATAASGDPFLQYVTGFELQREALRVLRSGQPTGAPLGQAAAHYVRAVRALAQGPGPHHPHGRPG
ncbi:MAG: O-antigen ligase family protein, partial [Candidatus Binatia bacterium]